MKAESLKDYGLDIAKTIKARRAELGLSLQERADETEQKALMERAGLIGSPASMLEALKWTERLYRTYGLLAQDKECGRWINFVSDVIRAAERVNGTQSQERT